jgi:hypothetical protein
MRRIRYELGLIGLTLLAGCNSFPFGRGNSQPPAAARVPAEAPSKESILAYLNDNANRVQSVRCKELDIAAKQGLQTVGLRGQVVCQKPRNFRMGANALGAQEVDVGSNDQEFWFWIKRNDPPYLFHCSYDDLARGNIRAQFPFQPEWIMEAMGIAPCGPAENYEVKLNPTTLELVENTRSPQGQPVRKITVINRVPVHGSTPQVTAHILQDARGQEICAAYISEVQIDKTTGAILPRKVRLVCPAEKSEMKLQLDDLIVNDPTIAQATQLFRRPNLTNVESFDLARGRDAGPNGVRHIGQQRMQ